MKALLKPGGRWIQDVSYLKEKTKYLCLTDGADYKIQWRTNFSEQILGPVVSQNYKDKNKNLIKYTR